MTVPVRYRGAYSCEGQETEHIWLSVRAARGFRRSECLAIAEMFEHMAYRMAMPDPMHPNDIGELTDAQKIAREFEGDAPARARRG